MFLTVKPIHLLPKESSEGLRSDSLSLLLTKRDPGETEGEVEQPSQNPCNAEDHAPERYGVAGLLARGVTAPKLRDGEEHFP